MNDYFTGFFTASCLVVSSFFFMGSKAAQKINEPILIVGERGTTKIGGGFIEIDGPSGKKIFDIIVGKNSNGELTIYNKNSINIAKITSNDDGDGFFNLYNNANIRVANIKSSAFGGFLSTYNNNNKQTAYLGTFRNLKGGLMTYNERFSLTSFIGASEKSDGKLSIYNNQGNSIVQIGALYNNGNSGEGFLSLHDRFGEYGWHKSGRNE